jgi:hypothetical protein
MEIHDADDTIRERSAAHVGHQDAETAEAPEGRRRRMIWEIKTRAEVGGGPLWVGHFETATEQRAAAMAAAFCRKHALRLVAVKPWLDLDESILVDETEASGDGPLRNRHLAGPAVRIGS